jgi:hypothetical protein
MDAPLSVTHQFGKTLRLFPGRQVLALQIFDERQHVGVILGLGSNERYNRKLWTGLQLGERGVPSWLLKPDGWNAVQREQKERRTPRDLHWPIHNN